MVLCSVIYVLRGRKGSLLRLFGCCSPLFVSRCREWLAHIVTLAVPSSEENMRSRSTAPMASFTSPFASMTPGDVNTIFLEHITPLRLVTNRLFIILDEQSINDDSCLLVEDGKDFDHDDEMTFIGTDFFVAINMAARAELGVTDLGENLDRDRVWVYIT